MRKEENQKVVAITECERLDLIARRAQEHDLSAYMEGEGGYDENQIKECVVIGEAPTQVVAYA